MLDTHLTHGYSFLVEVQPPLLHDAVRSVSTREHTFESPAVTLEAGDLPRFRNQVNVQLVTVAHQKSLKIDDERFATLHVGVEDALCMRTVVAVIERAERPNHEASDPFKVVSRCGANDDVVNG